MLIAPFRSTSSSTIHLLIIIGKLRLSALHVNHLFQEEAVVWDNGFYQIAPTFLASD
jgi:hypothetical protein